MSGTTPPSLISLLVALLLVSIPIGSSCVIGKAVITQDEDWDF